MQIYVLRKLMVFVPTVLVIVTVVFVVIRIAGGDPALAILGDEVDRGVLAAFRQKHGLDRPMLAQYFSYLSGLVRGDLGVSFATGRPVFGSYLQMLPYTLELVVASVILSILIGVPLGLVAAVKANTAIDYGLTTFSTLVLGFPVFFLAIVLLLVFAVRFDLFPVLGAGDLDDLPESLYHLVLPSLALGLVDGVQLLRVTRSTVIHILGLDYIRAARAKGVTQKRVIGVHALRNALIPIATVVGLEVAGALAGSILTETVFNRPGVGKLLVGAILARDYPLVQSGIVIFSMMVICVNLLVDLSVASLDPRVRFD